MMLRHVHMVGVSGTGMGALATLFRARGARVTGSDAAFDPPIGPALREAGVECMTGYDAAHLGESPDLVVVGNAIRKDNVEAVAALERGLARASMSAALREHFLHGRRAVVVAGTHGKTTTSSLAAHVLHEAGLGPGFFIGGIPKGFGVGAALGRVERSLVRPEAAAAPFVIEGDEYDAVYWHKQPKFFDYVSPASQPEASDVVVLTSIEHDHVDIYPTEQAYEQAFIGLLERVPDKGLLVVDAAQPRVVELARRHCRARVTRYGILDPGAADAPEWTAALGRAGERGQEIDVYAGGSDDFAHHPTAVDETLRALRRKHPEGRLWAVFEPRSATACRSMHQQAYVRAFDVADRVLLAPLGRTNIPEAERLDVARLARELGAKASAEGSVDAILDAITKDARAGDTVALLSNGAFGGVHQRLLAALKDRPAARSA
jgi:UDP-N-acetylmuramate: L-alanyl-gamma-D-glutamyl-meso-diaminopimelate ligase